LGITSVGKILLIRPVLSGTQGDCRRERVKVKETHAKMEARMPNFHPVNS
jgi:hypothetical protein